MVYFVKLAVNDLKNIVRDKFLVYALIAFPVMMIVVARIFVHWISGVYAIEGIYPLFFMLLVIMLPMIFGFISAFLIIDERDEHILTVLRVMPISRNSYLLYRMFFMSIFSFITILLFPALSGLLEETQFSYYQYIPVAVLFTLFTPFSALLVSTFANNKVQAFAIFKIGGTVFLVPLFAFFIADNLKYAFGVIPNFWSFMAMDSIIQEGTLDFVPLIIGFVFHLALLAVLFYKFNNKY